MQNKPRRCLLVWPPFVAAQHLPLGIPFLTAHLKALGTSGIEVIDLNMAYLRRSKLLRTLYILNRWYHRFLGGISQGLKKTPREGWEQRGGGPEHTGPPVRDKSVSKKMAAAIRNHLNKKMNEWLDHIMEQRNRSIPWSLNSILSCDFDGDSSLDKKKIYQILDPVITRDDFPLIGISVIYPQQLLFAFMTAKIIKDRLGSKAKVVLGGAQVTKHIDHIVKSAIAYECIDFFIAGDGDEPLAKLLEALPGQDFSSVPNLYFKRPGKPKGYARTDGAFRLTPKDFPVPDFTGFDLSLYKNQLPLLASRGCFWSKCSFCTYASMHEHRYFLGDAQETAETIKKLESTYRVSNYRFVDDALPPKFMRDLSRELIRSDLRIRWGSSIVLSREFARRDFLDTLRSAGLCQVSIGLESTSSRILGLMNKYHRDLCEAEIADILRSLKASGIGIGLHIMFGFPTETISEARKTLDFLTKNRNLYDMCMFQPFCLEDGTPVFNEPEKFGITKIYKADRNSGARLGYAYEVREGMSQEEAAEFTQKEAALSFKRAGVAAKCQSWPRAGNRSPPPRPGVVSR